MISILLVIAEIIPATDNRGSQICSAGATITFRAGRHHQLVGSVGIIKQGFWRHMLSRRGKAFAAAEVAVRKFFYEGRCSALFALCFTHSSPLLHVSGLSG